MASQLDLPDIPAPPAKGRPSRHTFGAIAARPLDEPLPDGTERLALVQTCRSCGCMRRLANTGARMGARQAWSLDEGRTWLDRAPLCLMKGPR